ncbi:glycosyltransferase [Mediterranea massiliensis]|uniref:glycosyltransferase n=1 Tax=Mediterranea massiliensis TaxID=1841865 RepID=UPI0009329DDF|nr:glycosyltransferase [Mediterranea massiliensis]
MEAFALDTTEQYLLAATGILFIVQALYYLTLYNRIHLRSRKAGRDELHFTQELPPLSVILCAHDEVENLRRNLPAIFEQDYPQFEVIVINDGEKGESEEYLTQLEEQYSNLYHSFVPDSSRYISRKKLAVTLGIRAARYDWLVLTEANCRPQSNQWLRLMARNFTSRTEVVLGYSGYERGHNWLHRRAAFDSLFTAMRYLGFALAGNPYMGIGRNLAYRKDLFFDQKGFSAHLNLRRGDDDLFVNQVARRDNTRVETDPASVVRMQPLFRAKDWREEKIGYASTAPLYHGMQRWALGFETFSRLLFHAAWIATVVISALHAHWLVAGLGFLLFVFRFVMQALVINTTAKDLDEKYRYRFLLPVFDVLQPLQSLRWKLYCLFRDKREFLRK